jgi:hypothetical protein
VGGALIGDQADAAERRSRYDSSGYYR